MAIAPNPNKYGNGAHDGMSMLEIFEAAMCFIQWAEGWQWKKFMVLPSAQGQRHDALKEGFTFKQFPVIQCRPFQS